MYYFHISGVRGFTNDIATWAKFQLIELDQMRVMLYEANPDLAEAYVLRLLESVDSEKAEECS